LGCAASVQAVWTEICLLDTDPGTGSPHPVTRILLLGGYGGFGSRIARRLAGEGHEVLVAGNNWE